MRNAPMRRVRSRAPYASEPDRLAPRRIARQIASVLVPVREHPALASVAVDGVNVAGRSVRVTVDETRIACRAQRLLDRVAVDVHDLGGFTLLRVDIAKAQPLHLGASRS